MASQTISAPSICHAKLATAYYRPGRSQTCGSTSEYMNTYITRPAHETETARKDRNTMHPVREK